MIRFYFKSNKQFILDSATAPFTVHVMINGKKYGVGSGASKKHARNEGALDAMDNLVPGFKVKRRLL